MMQNICDMHSLYFVFIILILTLLYLQKRWKPELHSHWTFTPPDSYVEFIAWCWCLQHFPPGLNNYLSWGNKLKAVWGSAAAFCLWLCGVIVQRVLTVVVSYQADTGPHPHHWGLIHLLVFLQLSSALVSLWTIRRTTFLSRTSLSLRPDQEGK